jgi:hypothetical protein
LSIRLPILKTTVFMKKPIPLYRSIISFLMICIFQNSSFAQTYDCTFMNPVIHIHFGSGNVRDINTSLPPNYTRTNSSCPIDGEYTFSSSTSECFHGDWHTISEDHTQGDRNGNMMLVNAFPGGGPFLTQTISSLKENTTYEIAAWLMNVCRPNGGCSPLPPDITIKLTTVSGKNISTFHTGLLPQIADPKWSQYRGIFTMPSGETRLILTMLDVTIGGCGNDFALDDITFRECRLIKPPVQTVLQPPSRPQLKQPPLTSKQANKKEPSKQIPVKKTIPPLVAQKPKKDTIAQVNTEVKLQPALMSPPPILLRTRANPLIRQIETSAGDIRVDLYDNAEIDGDTVSVYHNNELIVSRAMLTQKPITIHIAVDKDHPHHELVMVAHNLGSIPPNTALMIVTTKEKRYEVFISTTEQKNAKVVIDLKE